jgi:cytochrome P450
MSLAWAWHLLSTDARVERKLHEEVDAVIGDRAPTFDDLPNLPYARMVLEESMRLYPPAWSTSRQAHEADEVGGYRIPAGAILTISPYVTHRNPAFWDDPSRFEPARFAPERSAGRPDYAYFPFGGGPRRCVGSQFAMMEGQLALAMIARRFRLRPVAGHKVEPDPILTLRPRQGLPMRLEPRRR